ncbi:MAG: twin-arginine translocase TatA/TatE family subunit [Elusimicrobia bacterium]|nr:twin-arginine translocase TatA/TatE family subunit [Elusimicrobiota bacterium]
MLPNIGFGELAVILAIALLLFGAQRLPEVARGIGKSFNAFKRGLREVGDEVKDANSEAKALPEKKET